jgi:hypothetical protein
MLQATSLTDDALTVALARLAGREREATAALIVHLAEFDARRLYEGAGHSSMFSYCRAVLRLSEDAAYNRIKAARAARLYPGDRGDAGRRLAQSDDRSASRLAFDGGEPRAAPRRRRG